MKNSARYLLLLVSAVAALALAGPAAAHVRSDSGGAGLAVQVGEGAGDHAVQLGEGTSNPSRAGAADKDAGVPAELVLAGVFMLAAASLVVVRRRRSVPL